MSYPWCYKNMHILLNEIVKAKLHLLFEIPGTMDFSSRLQVHAEGKETWLSQKPWRNLVSSATITPVYKGIKVATW